MVAVASFPGLQREPDEQRMVLHGVTWSEYVAFRDLMDRPGLRMTYLEGALELMSPSSQHELWKKTIARFVELYAHVRGIDLYGYGSTTFRAEAKERGAEPDECYLVGKDLVEFPDIVLEVIHTSPLLDKLEVYAGFAIPEVWVFKDAAFALYAFDSAARGYVAIERSRLMPALDHAMIARYVVRPDTPRALREFEAELRG